MKITCNIIQDLLPLYVDQALSGDSCALVEEHLDSCEACRQAEEQLRNEQKDFGLIKAAGPDDADARKAFRGIRRSIWRKRILAACIAAACILAAVRAGYYLYYEKETFIPFEETGLEMRGDKLYATKTYYGRLSGLMSADQKTEFLYEEETAYVRNVYPSETCDLMVTDYREQLRRDPEDPQDKGLMHGVEKVYYVSEDCLELLRDFPGNNEGWEEWSREMEERSILLWDSVNGAAENPAE